MCVGKERRDCMLDAKIKVEEKGNTEKKMLQKCARSDRQEREDRQSKVLV